MQDWHSTCLKLASALQIGFPRMTGRLLEAVRIVPPALWRHLGNSSLRRTWHRCDQCIDNVPIPDAYLERGSAQKLQAILGRCI